MRNAYNILVGKPELKKQFGRSKGRWEDNIRIDVREIWWKAVDWIHLAQDVDHWRNPVKTVMNFRVP